MVSYDDVKSGRAIRHLLNPRVLLIEKQEAEKLCAENDERDDTGREEGADSVLRRLVRLLLVAWGAHAGYWVGRRADRTRSLEAGLQEGMPQKPAGGFGSLWTGRSLNDIKMSVYRFVEVKRFRV